MEVPDIRKYWSVSFTSPLTERMLPPGAVSSGFRDRSPGTPQELKSLML